MKKEKLVETADSSILRDLKYCVFDLETTGGNTKTDKIIEIGLVNIDGKEITESKTFLINPDKKIPDFIQKLTSIKQSDVEGAPRIEEVIEEILTFIGDRILVAHNASFDVPFLNSVLKRLERPEIENKSICTNLMTKYLIPTLMNSNLNYMSKIFKIQHKKAHRALDDAKATAKLFINYLNIFEDKGISKINHLYYPMNRFELDMVNYKKGHDHKEIMAKIKKMPAPYMITFKGENGVILYSFPCANIKAEHSYLDQKIKELDWENITLKLIGPFIECLLKYGHIFAKLDQDSKKEAHDKLWEFHLEDISKKEYLETASEIEKFDYAIINNLVPEQYTIYPLHNLAGRSELVFRYPGHKKKLVQYIGSTKGTKASMKLKKINISPMLRELVSCYLTKAHLTNKEIYLFNREAIAREEEFFDSFERFIIKNKNKFNYPQTYI